MSPLAEAIYLVLSRRTGLVDPLISYSELVKQLPSLAPPYDNITRNDERLFDALGEVGKACREAGLPTLTALVIRAKERSPGLKYYQLFHPETGDDPAKREEAWEEELRRVGSTTYPPSPGVVPTSEPGGAPDDRRRSRPLGHLRFVDHGSRSEIVFAGRLACPRCSASIEIEVLRNSDAVSPKQPPFLIAGAGASSRVASLGHLFIGTILTSPVLYYGSFNHCGHEQRLSVFYNRMLRDRSDTHLVVAPSTSGEANSAHEDAGFKLS